MEHQVFKPTLLGEKQLQRYSSHYTAARTLHCTTQDASEAQTGTCETDLLLQLDRHLVLRVLHGRLHKGALRALLIQPALQRRYLPQQCLPLQRGSRPDVAGTTRSTKQQACDGTSAHFSCNVGCRSTPTAWSTVKQYCLSLRNELGSTCLSTCHCIRSRCCCSRLTSAARSSATPSNTPSSLASSSATDWHILIRCHGHHMTLWTRQASDSSRAQAVLAWHCPGEEPMPTALGRRGLGVTSPAGRTAAPPGCTCQPVGGAHSARQAWWALPLRQHPPHDPPADPGAVASESHLGHRRGCRPAAHSALAPAFRSRK
jgi:hypothetical protein